MSRLDLDQQVDYGDGTLAWTAEAFDGNRISPITGNYHRLARLFCRAADEDTAYEVARQKLDQCGIRRRGRVITIKPATYVDLELQPMERAR